MNKIIIIIKLILQAKFIFKTPQKCHLVIYDRTSLRDLKNCISDLEYFVLETRKENVKEVYFSFKILFKIFKNFFKGNIFTVYLLSLIELIEPKVVITNIDNSFKFSEISKILYKKINFIAVQNAHRLDLVNWEYVYNKKKIKKNVLKDLFIPNFYCFGDYEKDLYNKLNIDVKILTDISISCLKKKY